MKGVITIIAPTGELSSETVQRSPGLLWLKERVGGRIQLVPGFTEFEGSRCVAYCNEEGKIRGLPLSATATALWHDQAMVSDVLVGAAVVIAGDSEFMNSL